MVNYPRIRLSLDPGLTCEFGRRTQDNQRSSLAALRLYRGHSKELTRALVQHYAAELTTAVGCFLNR
jgi:hypothetical protein